MDVNMDKMKALGQKHGPTLGIATAAVIAVKLMSSAPASAPPVAEPSRMAMKQAPIPVEKTPIDGVPTRVVSCGNSKVASVSGDDSSGTIKLGPGADGKCTMLFAAIGSRACQVVGGEIKKLTKTDLVIENVVGGVVAYECK